MVRRTDEDIPPTMSRTEAARPGTPQDRTMSRRRRSKQASLSFVEPLERRVMLDAAPNTVSIKAIIKSVDKNAPQAMSVYPPYFNVMTGSGSTAAPGTATITETWTPTSAAQPQLVYNNNFYAGSVTIGIAAGGAAQAISVIPTKTLNNVDEVVTLTITGVTTNSSCVMNPPVWSIGSPNKDSITFHDSTPVQVGAFCDKKPEALTASPGTGDVTPSDTSDAGVSYGNGGVSARSPSLLAPDGFSSISYGLDLGWTNIPGFGVQKTPGYSSDGSIFGIGMVDADLPTLSYG